MKRILFSSMPVLAFTFFLVSCGGANSDKSDKEAKPATDTVASTPPETVTPMVNTIVTTPQPMLIVVHKVANFQKWIAGFEAGDSMKLANGLHNYVVGRGVRDSNMLFVAVKADDIEKARAFTKMPGLKKSMQMAGVIGAPDFSVITTTWQDTVNIGDAIRSRTTFMVKDWETWAKNFADGKQERLDNGITDRAYGYDASDNKKISLITAVTDTAKAFAYYKSDAIKKRREAGGVTTEPKRFLFRIVKRY